MSLAGNETATQRCYRGRDHERAVNFLKPITTSRSTKHGEQLRRNGKRRETVQLQREFFRPVFFSLSFTSLFYRLRFSHPRRSFFSCLFVSQRMLEAREPNKPKKETKEFLEINCITISTQCCRELRARKERPVKIYRPPSWIIYSSLVIVLPSCGEKKTRWAAFAFFARKDSSLNRERVLTTAKKYRASPFYATASTCHPRSKITFAVTRSFFILHPPYVFTKLNTNSVGFKMKLWTENCKKKVTRRKRCKDAKNSMICWIKINQFK